MTDQITEIRFEVQDLRSENKLLKSELGTIDRRLSGIEDTLKWLVRLVIGALALALVTFIIRGGTVIG